MDNETRSLLSENAREYYRNALEAEKKGDWNTSVTLFFKALAVLVDLYILTEKKILPNNHGERFRILEENYHDIYDILDRDFSFYQNSYRLKLNKEACKMLRNDAEKLFEKLRINI